jgi:hypothetical protein
MNGPEVLVPVVLFLTIGVTVILRGPLGKALGERLAGSKGHDVVSREDAEALRAEMEEMRYRLTEVEERIDFAERMLVQRKQQQLPGGVD